MVGKTIEVDETLGNFTAVKGSHLPRISNSVQSGYVHISRSGEKDQLTQGTVGG